MKKRGLLVAARMFMAIFALVVFAQSSAGAVEVKQEWKDSPQILWKELRTNWDNNVNTYSTDLVSWGYKTKNYIKNFTTGKDDDGKTIEEDWGYKIFHVNFMKPNKILFTYKYSAHENTEEGSVIDRAVAYVLRYTDGTTFNYGHRGEDVAYIKFPYLTNKQFSSLPIPLTFKAAMKLLMIASRSEIYQRPLDELKDCRGYAINSLSIGVTMNKFDPAFANLSDKDYVVSVEPSPRFTKDDYDLNETTGWLTLKKSALSKKAEVVKLRLTDKNKARNKGVDTIEAFIDTTNMMFVGIHEYEGDKLVYVTQFFDMKINDPNVKEADWEDYFKGRNINADK